MRYSVVGDLFAKLRPPRPLDFESLARELKNVAAKRVLGAKMSAHLAGPFRR